MYKRHGTRRYHGIIRNSGKLSACASSGYFLRFFECGPGYEAMYVVNFHVSFDYTGTVIFEHPKDVTVKPNVWANFSCTVQCSLQPVKWYKTGRLNPIEHPTGTNIDGLEFNITSNSMCTSENKITYFLEVLATRQSHNSAFYCAAYENCIGCPETECKCGCVGLCYSRPAFLKGKPVKLKMLYLDFSVVPSLVLLPFKSHIT